MILQEQKAYCTDYFYLMKTSGYYKKNKCKIQYPCQLSANSPVPHSADIPAPVLILLKIWIMLKNPVTAMMQISKVKMIQLIKDSIIMS